MLKNRYFFYFVLLISILKIVLVAGNEIVAIPYDSESYVRQTAYHIYDLGAPPGYPFWLALSGSTGLPQRISIEALLILTSFVLSLWLRKMFGGACGGLAFLMFVMSPATYFMFDYALSDGFYACLSILAIAFSGILIFSKSLRTKLVAALFLGATMGWMALTRNEDPLLFAWVGLILLLLSLHSFRTDARTSCGFILRNVVLTGVAIAVPAVVMVESVNWIHLNKSGVFARTLAGLPGHTLLLRNLAEIDADETAIHYVPVSAKARGLAYKASPTLQKYMPSVEDHDSIFQRVSRETGLPPGEIGAGWIWHVFNVPVLQVNGVVGGELEYRRMNNELEAGFKSGLLKRKFILHSFATAPPMEILSQLPRSAWVVAKRSFQTYPQGIDMAHEKQLFDAVNLRRAALTGGGYRHAIQGWAFMENRKAKIKSVMFVDGSEQNPVTISYMPRTDVEEGFKKTDGLKPDVTGFKIDFYSSSQKMGKLLYFLEDGSTMIADDMPTGVKKIEPKTSDGSTLYQGIDFSNIEPVVRTGFRHRVQALLSSVANQNVVSSALIVALLALCVLSVAVGKHLPSRRSSVQLFAFMVAALFLLRTLFYAVLESEAWAVEVRYMLAANFMALALIAVLLTFCIDAIRNLARAKPDVSSFEVAR
ncbi:MAG: hypothetical protein ACRYGA_16570 [Janthinobacterium lividum]